MPLNPGSPNPIPASFYGYYLQGAYHLWEHGDYRLAPFARFERYNLGASYAGTCGPCIPSGLVPLSAEPGDLGLWPQNHDRVWTVGANFYIGPHLVLKGDYQWFERQRRFQALRPRPGAGLLGGPGERRSALGQHHFLGLVDEVALDVLHADLPQHRHGVGVLDALGDGLDVVLARAASTRARTRSCSLRVAGQALHERAVDLHEVERHRLEHADADRAPSRSSRARSGSRRSRSAAASALTCGDVAGRDSPR